MPAWLPHATLYAQLSPQRLLLRNAQTGALFDQPAVLALRAKAGGVRKQVAAVGEAALALGGQPGITLAHPFVHPRTLLADFVLAQELLKAALRTVWRPGWFALAPRLVLHPLGEAQGGLTPIELRALHELGQAAGARQVQVWQGPPLTDAQLRSGQYPAQGQVLAP